MSGNNCHPFINRDELTYPDRWSILEPLRETAKTRRQLNTVRKDLEKHRSSRRCFFIENRADLVLSRKPVLQRDRAIASAYIAVVHLLTGTIGGAVWQIKTWQLLKWEYREVRTRSFDPDARKE